MIPLAARRRAMLAAEHVDTSTMREAAIVGAIVRSVIACGRYNGPWISQYAVDMIAAFNLTGVDRTPPGLTEVAVMLEQFEESYSQPFPR